MKETNDPTTVIELNEVFAALDHPRRRYLLYTLTTEGDEESLPELATRIAAWEQDKPVDEVTDEEQKHVQVSLYHSHVPKLAELNVVEFDEQRDVVIPAPNSEQVGGVLDGAGAELDSRQESHARENDV